MKFKNGQGQLKNSEGLKKGQFTREKKGINNKLK